VAALAEAGIERTFAIQELTLPLALAGEDVIGQARTGMGKTLGFGVPLLQRVTPPAEQPAATVDGEAADRTKDVPQALVVVPTRELCVQVAKDLADAGAKLDVKDVGGRSPMTFAQGTFLAIRPPVAKPEALELLKKLGAQ